MAEANQTWFLFRLRFLSVFFLTYQGPLRNSGTNRGRMEGVKHPILMGTLVVEALP